MKSKYRSLFVGTLGVLMLSQQAPAQVPAASDRVTAVADARAGRWDQAEATLAALAATEPTDVEVTVLLVQRRLQQKRNKEAVELMERVVAAAPNRPELQSLLGSALAQRINEVSFIHQAILASQMRTAFEKSVELDPKHLPGLIGLSRYFMNAPAIAGGSYAKADEYAAKVEKLDPLNGALSFALIRERDGKLPEAAEYYRKALAHQPQNAGLHTALGGVLARAGKNDEARGAFEAALKLQPDNAPARDGLAALAVAGK
jgi:Flp pilus assembly protein TadD